jgi:hypothetical protein
MGTGRRRVGNLEILPNEGARVGFLSVLDQAHQLVAPSLLHLLGHLVAHGGGRCALLLGVSKDASALELHLLDKLDQLGVVLFRLPRKARDEGGS